MSESDDVGERIKAVMDPAKDALNLPWSEIGHRARVHEGTIHRWRRGEGDRNGTKVRRVEAVLRLQPGSIEAAARGDNLPDSGRHGEHPPELQLALDAMIRAYYGESTSPEDNPNVLVIDDDDEELRRRGRQLALTPA